MSDDEFYHWGIQNMKWGVRRFQNEDGSLTPEGRERYRKNKSNGKNNSTKKDISGKRTKENEPNKNTKENKPNKITGMTYDEMKKASYEYQIINDYYRAMNNYYSEQQRYNDYMSPKKEKKSKMAESLFIR